MEMSQNHLKFLRENPVYIDGIRQKKIAAGIVEDSESMLAMNSLMEKYSESNFDITEEFDNLFGEFTTK